MNFHLHLDSEQIQHLPVGDSLYVGAKTSIREVMHRLKEARTGSTLVLDGEQLVGIFTERDALKLMAKGADWDAPIESVMTTDPVTIPPEASVASAIHKMSAGGYRRLPVVDATDAPQRTLKVSHILHYLVEHFPRYVYTLPPSPHQTTQNREGA